MIKNKQMKIELTKKELKLIEKSLWNRLNTMGVDEVRTYESIIDKIEKLIIKDKN
jgi:hypothetical protein